MSSLDSDSDPIAEVLVEDLEVLDHLVAIEVPIEVGIVPGTVQRSVHQASLHTSADVEVHHMVNMAVDLLLRNQDVVALADSVLVDCKTRDSAAAVGPMEDSFEARRLMECLELLLMADYCLRVMRE